MGNVCCSHGDPKRGSPPAQSQASSAENVNHSSTTAHTILEQQPADNGQCAKVCTHSQKSTIELKGRSHSANGAMIGDLFNKYKSPDQDIIEAEGICQLCEDLELEADDFRILVLAWYCQASQMCQFTREEFTNGLLGLKADSISSLKTALQDVSSQLKPLTSIDYHSLYKWAFSFALESETQRTLSVEMASQLWKVVFSPDEPPILDFWLNFLESSGDSVRGISRDTWNLFLIFVRRCAHDLSTYDETEAWPSLFDDFVHFHNDQTNQNCSKTSWDGTGGGNVISSP
ncbi:DCN1-like protein 3 [Galendromus occidentalis]|uniref:Defective in cullin neddylation protein n=1 Tax=Galendromus occidentalis TaxID=34638 RepID=A0AAJ6QNX6_9ACAR|nr:DCN1-like protein 3 [Galendromus occidentalis]